MSPELVPPPCQDIGNDTTEGEKLREATEPLWSHLGLIRRRSSTFIGIQINVAMQVTDVSGICRTIIPTTENRKVTVQSCILMALLLGFHSLRGPCPK